MSKNVIILGASSDIGLKLTEKFLKNNYKVNAHYHRSLKRINNLSKNYKNLNKLKLNLADSSIVKKFLKKKIFSNNDIFINLVGFTDNISFEKFDEKNLINSLKVNYINPTMIMKDCLKNMLDKGWGRILNASSIGVKFGGGKLNFNYSFSKHSYEFIPSDYKIWCKKNVLINTLRIGVTDTKIHKKIINKNIKKRVKLIPIGRMAKTNEVAEFIYFLTTNSNSYITGEVLSISGGE